MDMRLRLSPGYVTVQHDPTYADNVAGILFLPDSAQDYKAQTGVIVDIEMRPVDNRANGCELHVGDRVLCPMLSGVCIDEKERLWTYRLSYGKGKHACAVLLATLDPAASVEATQQIQRCRYCGPAVQGSTGNNMILVDGVCPRCGKDDQGRKPRDKAMDVSDEEVGHFREVNRLAREARGEQTSKFSVVVDGRKK